MSFTDRDRTLLYGLTGLVGVIGFGTLYDIYRKYKEGKTQKPDDIEDNISETDSTIESPFRKKHSKKKTSNIKKVVLTGGPCAGKTTALALISNRLRERGIRVYLVPECASIVANGGGLININKMTAEENIKFQSALTQYIMDQEDRFYEIAKIGTGDAVLICDRGVLDNRAYCPPESWNALMDENGWNTVDLRDKRYDAVVHLVTAADGAEQYYTLENNTARYESDPEVARQLDKRLQEAWYGHPRYRIIDNNVTSFDEKINNAYIAVLELLGYSKPDDKKLKFRKYTLKKFGNEVLPVLASDIKREVFKITDIYLKSDVNTKNDYLIRKRCQNDKYLYERFEIVVNEKGERFELRKNITGREFITFSQSANLERKPVEKTRTSFIWQNQMLFIDTYFDFKGGFSVIYLSEDKKIEEFKLPHTLEVEKDVTDDPEYTTLGLAKSKN